MEPESPCLALNQNLGPLIKAMPWRDQHPEDQELCKKWASESGRVNLAGFLIDAFDPRQWGGTGVTTQWDLLYPRPALFGQIPLILAGGLNAENVSTSHSTVSS